jgi:ATP-binding cassette subfamily B protein
MVESLALTGGLSSAVARLELVLAAAVLALGSGGIFHVLLLVAWVAVAGLLAWGYAVARARWTSHRLDMTHDLVERMNGHRTRLAQSPPGRWHDGEDEALDGYLEASATMDRRGALLSSLVPRGWLIVGLCGLGISAAPGFAVGLGGVLLAHQALQRLMAGAAQLAGAAIAWKRVQPLFDSAATATPEREPAVTHSAHTVLEANDLSFRYSDRAEPSLKSASLRIEKGDWLLLEGSSGGGKSTLAALLAGLRRPESGLLLAGGLDRATLGAAGWRRRVAAAPQYHENHIFAGSLAFNLLMGRQWPPTASDMSEATAACKELGLGGLLERMPAGLEQMVGDTGWQLSQGERSRVYLARVLLQKPELVVLDESFAALDPASLRQSLECVLRRAETLLVVAHP